MDLLLEILLGCVSFHAVTHLNAYSLVCEAVASRGGGCLRNNNLSYSSCTCVKDAKERAIVEPA